MVERRNPIAAPIPEQSNPGPQFPDPAPQAPEVGHSVVYQLTLDDLSKEVNSIAIDRVSQIHITGDSVPAVITRVNDDGTVNLHLLLDGPATHWISGIPEGAGKGEWAQA